MKKSIVLFSFMLMLMSVSAQEKNKKVSFEVDGVCGMCKARIEKAAVQTKGVKYASWDVSSHELSLVLDERKCSVVQVKKAVAAVGHDTDEVVADDEVYENLMACCLYRGKTIHDDENEHEED